MADLPFQPLGGVRVQGDGISGLGLGLGRGGTVQKELPKLKFIQSPKMKLNPNMWDYPRPIFG